MEISTTLHTPEIVTLSYEMITAPIRRFIESQWNIPLINLYGTTELGYLYVEEDRDFFLQKVNSCESSYGSLPK